MSVFLQPDAGLLSWTFQPVQDTHGLARLSCSCLSLCSCWHFSVGWRLWHTLGTVFCRLCYLTEFPPGLLQSRWETARTVPCLDPDGGSLCWDQAPSRGGPRGRWAGPDPEPWAPGIGAGCLSKPTAHCHSPEDQVHGLKGRWVMESPGKALRMFWPLTLSVISKHGETNVSTHDSSGSSRTSSPSA